MIAIAMRCSVCVYTYLTFARMRGPPLLCAIPSSFVRLFV